VIDVPPEDSLHRFEEIRAVRLCLESGEVAGQQTIDQLSCPQIPTKHVERRPGSVPDGYDRGGRKTIPEFARRQPEVMVLDQEQRSGASGLLGHCGCEAAIQRSIGEEIGSRAVTRLPEDRRDRSVPSAPRSWLTGLRFDRTIA
jgi:hypothetical protein